MFQSLILCTVSLVVISSFRVHRCVDQVPQLPTSVASHDDRHDGYGCSGSRPSSCVVRAWFVNQDCWWNLVWKPSIWHLRWRNWWHIGTWWGKVLKQLTVQWIVLCSLGRWKPSDPSQWCEVRNLQFTWSSVQNEMATVEELVQRMNIHCKDNNTLWIKRSGGWLPTANSSEMLAHQDKRRLRLQWDTQFKQRRPLQTHDKMCARAQSTWRVFANLLRWRDTLQTFTEWLRKTTGFLIAACGSFFRTAIEWVDDQDNVITNNALDQQFGPLGEKPVCDALEKCEQVHVSLVALTEKESSDIVLGPAPYRSWLFREGTRWGHGVPAWTLRQTVEGCSQQTVTRQQQKKTRFHSFNQGQHPFFHDLWQQIQAGFLPFAPSPAYEKDIHHFAHLLWGSGWCPKFIAASLHCNWANSSFDLSKFWDTSRIVVPKLIRPGAFSSTEEFAPRFDMLAFSVFNLWPWTVNCPRSCLNCTISDELLDAPFLLVVYKFW